MRNKKLKWLFDSCAYFFRSLIFVIFVQENLKENIIHQEDLKVESRLSRFDRGRPFDLLGRGGDGGDITDNMIHT